MKSNFKKQIIIALLGIIILSSWFCSIREVLAFIKINPANPKIQISSLQKGLVGHWNLDSESYNAATKRFTDKSAYSNHGTSANAAVFAADRMGQADKAMTFNGTSDYVNAGNGASLTTQGARTAEFWMKSTQLAGNKGIIGFNSTGTNIGFSFIGNAPLLLLNTENYRYWNSSNSYFDGTWKHFVITLPNTTQTGITGATLTINGVLIGANTSTSSNLPLAWDIHLLGRNIYGYFNGSIDEVRIYNRALSAEEILQSYNSYRPKISAGSLQKGLVLDMPMDSGYTKSTTVLTDRTPYSNNGTAVNGPVIGADYTTFDGVNDYVNAGNGASLAASNETTITAWVKTTSSASQYVVQKGDSYYVYANKGLGFLNGRLTCRYDISSDEVPTFYNGQWHFITTVVKVGEAAKFYFDGNPIGGSSTIVDAVYATTLPLIIGRNIEHDISSKFFNGSIDEVRIYNRALSAEEIQLSYDKSKGRH